jgi:hypothetical protein
MLLFDPPEREDVPMDPPPDPEPPNPTIDEADVDDDPDFDEVEIVDTDEFGEPIEPGAGEDADDL